jgi:hypothetical protein
VLYNGATAATLADSSQATLALSSTSRGRVERVDLQISIVLEDLDGNGLIDAWERLYFGRTGVDPLADPDGDGLDNLAEQKAGTNPNDFQSQFRFVRVTRQAQGMLVEWSSVANRRYTILRSTDVLGAYQVIADDRLATPPTNSHLDATVVPSANYFYRLRLRE